MRTLLVPCAGSRKINQIPVFLNNHPDGKLLAEKCLEGIYSETYDRIVFSVLDSMNSEYNARNILLSKISNKYPIDVISLPRETSGPADTVYQSIMTAGIEGEFAVRDCLNSIIIEKNVYGNFVSGLDLTTYNQDVYKVRTKSFIIVNEQNQILDIVEKKFRSDVISVGLYGFKNTSDYIIAYEKLSDSDYPIRKLYISNIISFLIGYSQRVFHCLPVTTHEDWGSLETWNLLQRDYATYIIDADGMIDQEFTEDDIGRLSEILLSTDKRHISYVIVTTNCNIDFTVVRDRLNNQGINCVGVVGGISHSMKKLIVSNPDELRIASLGV